MALKRKERQLTGQNRSNNCIMLPLLSEVLPRIQYPDGSLSALSCIFHHWVYYSWKWYCINVEGTKYQKKQYGGLNENPWATQSRNEGKAARALKKLSMFEPRAILTHIWDGVQRNQEIMLQPVLSFSLTVYDADQPFQDRSRLYHGSLCKGLSQPELALPREQRVKVLRMITALSPQQRDREGVQRASTPRGDLSPPFFWNRQCSFEMLPMEVGPNPHSWNFYKLSVWDRKRQTELRFLKGICSFFASFLTRPRSQHSDSRVLLSYAASDCLRIFTELKWKKALVGRERIQSIWKNEESVTSHRKLSRILPEERF